VHDRHLRPLVGVALGALATMFITTPGSPAAAAAGPAHLAAVYTGVVDGSDGSDGRLLMRVSGDGDLLYADINITRGLVLSCHGEQDVGMVEFWMSGSRQGSIVSLRRQLTTQFSGRTVDLTISSRATVSADGRSLSGPDSVHVGLPWYTSDCDVSWSFRAVAQVPNPAPALPVVPDLRHRSVSDALSRLRDAGLVPGRRTEQVDPDCGIDIGRVAGQNPAAGQRVRPGTAVDYVIAVLPTGNTHCN
jgi:hypothetical protein